MTNKSPVDRISTYLQREGLTRKAFAFKIGMSKSMLDQVLRGAVQPSAKMLARITAATGLSFDSATLHSKNPFDLPNYNRVDVLHMEGLYQVIRPCYRNAGGINCYGLNIKWDDEAGCLLFAELGNGHSPFNSGYVSMPLFNRIVYLVTTNKGNFRLACLSDAYEPGLFYGGIFTVGSRRMSENAPIATTCVIKKVEVLSDILTSPVGPRHPLFSEFMRLLIFAENEGFFSTFTVQR